MYRIYVFNTETEQDELLIETPNGIRVTSDRLGQELPIFENEVPEWNG